MKKVAEKARKEIEVDRLQAECKTTMKMANFVCPVRTLLIASIRLAGLPHLTG